MNAPLIWIFSPLLFSFVLVWLGRWKRLVIYMGASFSILLAVMNWVVPVGKAIRIGLLVFEINPTWSILGRRFTLEMSDRPLVLLFNIGIAFWFIGIATIEIRPIFVALGMALTSLLSAAILVQPFFYGAILLQGAGMLSVVLFASCSRKLSVGMLRFLIFQTLAMPCLLLAGWMLSGTETTPGEISQAGVLGAAALLGFGMLLGVFPFHSWMEMIAESESPYVVAFLFFFFPFATAVFAISFLELYNWLYTSSLVLVFLRLTGFIMMIVGGLGAAFQRHLGKLMGYVMITEVAITLLTISLGLGGSENRPYQALIFAQLLPRGLALAVLSLALEVIKSEEGELSLPSLAGAGRKYPIASLAFFMSILAMIGYPLTVGFPTHVVVWQGLFQQFPLAGFSAIAGSVGVFIGGLRGFSVLIKGEAEAKWVIEEKQSHILLLGLGIFAILILGLIPQIYFPWMFNLGITFLAGG